MCRPFQPFDRSISVETKGEWHEIPLNTRSGKLTSLLGCTQCRREIDHATGTTVGTQPYLDRTMSAIVIYEEDDLMRTLLEEWLSEAGYCVRVTAAREAERTSPADLVIVSIYMPKQAGAPLVRKIQAAHPGTPMIALSGQFRSGLSAAGATADALGVQQVIAKPLTREDLLGAVRGMIGSPD